MMLDKGVSHEDQTALVSDSAIGVPEGSGGLLERAGQLRLFGDLLEAVQSTQRGRLVLVRGEAGVGKTVVVRRFCEEWRPPARILWGACEALFTPRALGPLVDVARNTGGELEQLVDRGGHPYEVLAALVREVSDSRPTVLVLEDLHWADEATLDVLRLLGRRVDGVRALVVATYRDDELGEARQLRVVLGELARAPGIDRVDLPRLSREAVAELAEPYDVDEEALYRSTGGNSFFVSEVLAAATKEIPSTVRDAVLARAARLSDAARRLLEALTVASPVLELGVLEPIAGDAMESLEECISSGMVVPATGGVAFRHELARLVIEESMTPNRRSGVHQRALAAMADSPDHARLAHHAEAADDADAVLRFAPRAARRAAALGAHRESAAQYERALRFADILAPEQRAELLECRSYECMLTDQIDESLHALRTAIALRRELRDVQAEGGALHELSNVLWCPGLVVEAAEAARQAVAVLEAGEPGPELAMAYCRLAQLCMDSEDVGGAVEWGTRARELSEALGDEEMAIHALNSIGTTRFMSGQTEGREQLERSLALATEAGVGDDVSRAIMHLVWVARRWRDYPLAYQYLEQGLKYTSERGLELWRSYLLGYRAQIELDLGRWQDAVETAALVLREPRRSRMPRIVTLAVVGRVRARRGDPEIWPPLDEALSLAERGEELQAIEPVAVARAEAAWLEGDRDGVERATTSALALARLRRAPWVVAELASWRRRASIVDQLPVRETTGPYSLELAGECSHAAARWQELGCQYEAALALGGSDEDAALRRALEQLRALNAQPAAAIIAGKLRARGARGLPRGPRRQTRTNPAGLTARELEVLALLTDGLRNTEIARRLVVSEKTVDHHVSAILRKLGVRTRGEASAKATRLELVAPGPAGTA
jgi:ATP/maltotriose-dependent transcriptional regulator MalT